MPRLTDAEAQRIRNKYTKIPGITNLRDRIWILVHPNGAEIAFTDYNQEITGHTDNAEEFPELGEFIHYGGNAYYVVGEANRRGFYVIDGGPHEPKKGPKKCY